MPNNYLQFDGSTGYVTVPSNAAVNVGTDDFSISCWVKFFTYTGEEQEILSKTYQAPPATSIAFELNLDADGRMEFIVGGSVGVGETAKSANVVPLNIWKHVVISFYKSISGTCTCYIDGVPGTPVDVSAVGNLDNSSNLIIGAFYSTISFEHTLFLPGLLDDLRIYKSELTQADVTCLWNNGVGRKYVAGQLLVEPSFIMEFDEGTGNPKSTIPSGAGQLTGTITDGVTWQSGGVPFDIGDSVFGRTNMNIYNALTNSIYVEPNGSIY